MTLYLHHNFVLIRGTYPESLEKNRQGDGELRHVTSFPYIFPYYDVIDKNADVSENIKSAQEGEYFGNII